MTKNKSRAVLLSVFCFSIAFGFTGVAEARPPKEAKDYEDRIEKRLSGVYEAVSWGTDTTAFDPSVPGVVRGHSISRIDPDMDTDTAVDWQDSAEPTPGDVPVGGGPVLE